MLKIICDIKAIHSFNWKFDQLKKGTCENPKILKVQASYQYFSLAYDIFH